MPWFIRTVEERDRIVAKRRKNPWPTVGVVLIGILAGIVVIVLTR